MRIFVFLIISNVALAYNATWPAQTVFLLVVHSAIPRFSNDPLLTGAQFGFDFTFGLKNPVLFAGVLLGRYLLTGDKTALSVAQSLGNMILAGQVSKQYGLEASRSHALIAAANGLFHEFPPPKSTLWQDLRHNIRNYKVMASAANSYQSYLLESGILPNKASLATGLTAGAVGLTLLSLQKPWKRWGNALVMESGFRVAPALGIMYFEEEMTGPNKLAIGLPLMLLANHYMPTLPGHGRALFTFLSVSGNVLACMSLGDLLSIILADI